jgi:formate dehydrogenase subunit gamma
MSAAENVPAVPSRETVRTERTFLRFTFGQRWEHALLILTFTVLLLTGLPQKFRTTAWSQQILATPERLLFLQNVHHIAAMVLAIEAGYHVIRGLVLIARRKLSAAIFPTRKDVSDVFHMLQYLLFLREDKPAFGKYNFEQKVTYWFLFFAIAIMGFSGLILRFPEEVTRVLPGAIIPAAKLAHSTEAVVATIFIVLWHFYHVHVERLNLSIFTGRINEQDLKAHHTAEYQRLMGQQPSDETSGENP